MDGPPMSYGRQLHLCRCKQHDQNCFSPQRSDIEDLVSMMLRTIKHLWSEKFPVGVRAEHGPLYHILSPRHPSIKIKGLGSAVRDEPGQQGEVMVVGKMPLM